ncbi:MAG: hypothetical protein JNM63_12375, partial [Spirochaetia bacterium]|nr:hypothetical protein [Spirochaetia bacterium]
DKPYRTDRLIVGWSTECEALTREFFPNLSLPGTDEYAADKDGVPNWRKRYKIPTTSVEMEQEKIIPLQKADGKTFSDTSPVLISADKSNFQELPPGKPKDPWKGPEDLSGKFFLANDDSFLYIRIEVRDDRHVDPPADPAQMWKADSVQIGIAAYDGKKNLECGLALRGSETLFAFWQSPVKDADKRIERSALQDGDRIIYSIRVPLEMFGLKPGDLCGVSAVANDADAGERKGFLEFGTGIGLSKDPESYNHYRLAR